ncbi:exodeoxyribonuclease VII large subunit [Natronospira proteinivora]|uniref:Exodeoxyribonuclease 7 large subunit n=1 Tax=Natronospira proteinivora TaxID=1807133 RepID=A0ABT1GAN5_9GAMM|nr:exodeoxyribonuclease VII large subunit [Natronospira proteinivora]MCP1727313.1 exodeoxyribonuclease VII large subunit [Natronospira proteinivora]
MTQTPVTTPDSADIWTVSRLNREARFALEQGFPALWIEGEISNLARPASGHMYFSLKDDKAQVRCAMFRPQQRSVRFRPENGEKVLVRARVGLYEVRGEFQLKVEHMEPAGEGELQRAFEALKQKLAAEGLFDETIKRPLPAMPRTIGVITSPTGAAIRDILTTLKRRFPLARVIIYPVPVQGEGAAARIADMLTLAGARAESDVLILARGGGSLEDLWSFNEEIVARAVRACPIPVVCGVGHEVDFTIADFAADYRAPTPTGAAEAVTPDSREWLSALRQRQQRLTRAIQLHLRQGGERHRDLDRRLQLRHPGQQLQQQSQRLDELALRAGRVLQQTLKRSEQRLGHLRTRLHAASPALRLGRAAQSLLDLDRRLRRAVSETMQRRRERLSATVRALNTVSPLATLERGYAIVERPEGGIIRRADELMAGDEIQARLGSGRISAHVIEVDTDTNPEQGKDQ